MEEVVSGFRAFVARTFGDEGRRWLATLPGLAEELAREWEIELGAELQGGVLSHVREATTADGAETVLKIGPPWRHARDEIAALEAWTGRGAPALLRADAERHALLLERIRPGGRPAPGSAEEVARVLGALHVPAPAGLPGLRETVWQRLDRAEAEGRAAPAKLAWARATVERLEQDPVEPALLHGDFDTRNLLICARRGLCAIDPLPCVGDPAYDAAHWVHDNRRPGRRERLEGLLAATGLPRARVRDWAGVVGVHG